MDEKDFIGPKVYYDDHGQMIFSHKDDDGVQLILDVRGWGAIQHLFDKIEDAEKFQDAIGNWIAEAINEKLNDLKVLYERRGYIRGKLHTFFLCDDHINLNDLEYQAYETDLKEVERKIKELEG